MGAPSARDEAARSARQHGRPHAAPLAVVRCVAFESSPSLLLTMLMLCLIFGGCCSNVYALEAIVKFDPSCGTLLTFVQFLFVAVTGYVTQFDKTRPPFFITPAKVPLRRWMVNIVLFFAINVLNNHAFSYNISVPVHIILRSGGSITTMAAGYLYGKRYSRIQASAVFLLSVGVVLAASSDAEEKVGTKKESTREESVTGLVILFVSQLLSAVMGLYTEATYQHYGPQWKENLFYSHLLSLPLFLPFTPAMIRTLRKVLRSELLVVLVPLATVTEPVRVPIQLVFLATNLLTQYACIRGVNLLAATSTALTVTIVLNIRKLVSLLLSIWLFGNSLSQRTLVSALIVFGSGALYSVGSRSSQPLKNARDARAESDNGNLTADLERKKLK